MHAHKAFQQKQQILKTRKRHKKCVPPKPKIFFLSKRPSVHPSTNGTFGHHLSKKIQHVKNVQIASKIYLVGLDRKSSAVIYSLKKYSLHLFPSPSKTVKKYTIQQNTQIIQKLVRKKNSRSDPTLFELFAKKCKLRTIQQLLQNNNTKFKNSTTLLKQILYYFPNKINYYKKCIANKKTAKNQPTTNFFQIIQTFHFL
eukprot:TRINITY_DN2232_c1_g1_i1.p4 TRINITY_DN2232_c1_g1~~TRINITY_DN2232_c1_g1_i1.p4  ORF type:complete len:199 (+),score=4.18 TRINITY_DN2232_c1_g1_i1:1411-2007(+)